MKNIIKPIVCLIFISATALIFSSDFDRVLYVSLAVLIYFVITNKDLRKIPYIVSAFLIASSSLMFLIDPLGIHLAFYIFKSATWSFYFILVGVISDFITEFRK